jgi:hypothetical protein
MSVLDLALAQEGALRTDMKYYENVLGLIGHTPLVKINRLNKGPEAFDSRQDGESQSRLFRQRSHRHLDDSKAPSAKGKLKPGGHNRRSNVR